MTGGFIQSVYQLFRYNGLPQDVSQISADVPTILNSRTSTSGLVLRLKASSGQNRINNSLLRLPVPQGPDLSQMDVGETINGAIDFGLWLGVGETITSITSVTAFNYSPTGGASFITLNGSPQLGTASVASGGSGVTNAAVIQSWTGANPGVVRVTATVLTSASQTLIGWAHQPITVPD